MKNQSLEKIVKKGKDILKVALFGAVTLYNCQNVAQLVTPKRETKEKIFEKLETKSVTLSLENKIKTYAFGHHGFQRLQHSNPSSYYNFNYRYPDQTENVQINVQGNLDSQEKTDLFNELEGQYELSIYTQKNVDTGEKIKVDIVQENGKLFLRLPYFGTNNKTSTNQEAETLLSKNYDLNERKIPNGVYNLKGDESLKKLFAKETFGVLDKDSRCKEWDGAYADPKHGGCTLPISKTKYL